jgi:hypothetical protein
MEVSGQLHVPAALLQESPVYIGYEAGGLQSRSEHWIKEQYLAPARRRSMAVQPLSIRHTD